MQVYRIAPNLYQSGLPSERAVYGDTGITAVVCLDPDDHDTDRDSDVYIPYEFHDGPLSIQPGGPEAWGAAIRNLARTVHRLRGAGHRVLVHCYAGLNRSGVVVARALMHDGYSADEAIDAVRAGRGAQALFNDEFCEWLREEERRDPMSDPAAMLAPEREDTR